MTARGLGQFRGAGTGTVLCLDCNSGYTTVCICQNSQNCNLKSMNYNYLKINGQKFRIMPDIDQDTVYT